MTAYARWTRTITDAAGNILNATVSVYRESDGLLATIYSDRAGATPKSNPFTLSNSDYGLAVFHAAGGAYKIMATRGSYSQTWRWEAIGTAAEYDVGSFVLSGQAPATVFSIAALKALPTATYKTAVLNLGGQSGEFVFLSGADYTARITADTTGAIYLKADDTATTVGAWVRVYAESVNVRWAGAVGDGTTDDQAAIQAALDLVKALGGGVVYFPRGTYKLSAGLTYDVSAEASRFGKRLRLKGDGSAVSALSMTGLGSALFTYTGNASYVESYFDIDGLRFTGNNTVSSKGLVVSIAAFMHTYDFVAEGFDYNTDMTDVEQAEFENSNWRWGLHGLRYNAAASATSANSLTFINCAIANNTTWGGEFTNPNAVQFLGGSVQYNGSAGGGSTQWGLKTIEAGNGYGTISFIGVAFEGNGGLGDHVSSQSTYVATHEYIGCGFTRPNSTNYATNFITCLGSTASVYRLSASTLRGYGAYVANAARPYIALTNTSALFFDDGSNVYGSATEQPSWAGYARFPAKMMVGSGAAAIGTFSAHAAADQNFYVAGKSNLSDGVKIGSVDDANGTVKGLEIDGSSILLSISGAGKALLSSSAFAPNADDGLALGSATKEWSDLFLAAGAVVNFAAGDVTITHSTDVLSFAGAASGYKFDSKMVVGGSSIIGTFTAHPGVDQNFYVAANFSLSDGIAFGSINDANNTLKGMEFRASEFRFTASAGAKFSAGIYSIGATQGIGYATGAGGAVTQLTSKSTGVTLNTACGQITLNNAALASATAVSFTLTDSAIAAGDNVRVWHQSGGTAGAYALTAQSAAGSASITVRNLTAGSLSEAIVLGFEIGKAVTS